MENELKISGTVRICKQLYPSTPVYDNDFKILSVAPVDIEEGEEHIELSPYGNFVVKGYAPNDLSLTEPYQVTIMRQEEDDPKYGAQYDLVFLTQPVDVGDLDSQRKFLSSILTEKQTESLFDTLESPLETLREGDIDSLTLCDGIGVTRARKMISKVKSQLDYSQAYVELYDYNLTNNMILGLVERYGSPNLVVQKIKDNPYILATEVKGIGFKKADKIALDNGFDVKSQKRFEAFMVFYLTEKSLMGDSWVSPNELFGNLFEVLELDSRDEENRDVMRESLYNLTNQGLIWYDEKQKDRIALSRVRNVEKSIATELIRISEEEGEFHYHDWEQTINETEELQGWQFTEQQREGIETVLENNCVMITGYGGCVDKDTEYFNGKEWKAIDSYKDGESVLQFNPIDRKGELITPDKYVVLPETRDMYHLKSQSGHIDQVLSEEHNFVYETETGAIIKRPFLNIYEKHKNSKKGFYGNIMTTFNHIKSTDVEFEIEDLKLQVIAILSGNYWSKLNPTSVRVKPKNELQILHLEQTLLRSNTEHTKKDGVYTFEVREQLKEFPTEWYGMDRGQLLTIIETLDRWGITERENQVQSSYFYHSCNKQNIDFIQYCYSALGIRAHINIVGERRNATDYRLSIFKDLKSSSVSMKASSSMYKTKITKVKAKDGKKYCFEVPSGMLILRRNGRIFVTGNTGKTSIVSGMLDVLKNYSFKQGALSGRAGARLAEVTGEEGYTIHRMLGWDAFSGGFIKNKNNPLDEDIIIIDELSMVGAELFRSLVEAIKDGAKLIMISDVGQLESIGLGNVAKDIIDSEIIPVVNLTEIHRQAKKSAIVTESLKVRLGEQLVNSSGVEVRGELEDLVLDVYTDKAQSNHKIISHYKKQMEEANYDSDKVQIVVPMRVRGDISTHKLNNQAQEISNPQPKTFNALGGGEAPKKEVVVNEGGDTEYVLRVGDKVINNVNQYEAELYFSSDEEREEYREENHGLITTAVFNGDTGTLVDIDFTAKELIIDFVRIGKVTIDFSQMRNIGLAYAMTVHKLQGSEVERVIIGLDYSAFMLLSKEWVYTAITRGKTHCTLCAELGALKKAISTSNVGQKQTFLQEFLKEELEVWNSNCNS